MTGLLSRLALTEIKRARGVTISLMCECGCQFKTALSSVGQRTRCPDCGRELNVPKPSLLLEDEWIPFKPQLTVTSGKAIASLLFGALFFFACLSGIPAILLGRGALHDIRQSGGRVVGKRMATTGIALGLIGCLFTFVLLKYAFGERIEWARQARCTHNLKQIGLAFHAYHEGYGSFPSAAITDKNGRPLLSWRVTLLPYLEQRPLYKKFHLDEPWDSPHNRALLESMPRDFDCPSDRTKKPGMTGYQAVVGPDTAFTPDFRPLRYQDFTDGTSYTLLIGETRRCVPWTKPEDLPFDMGIPLMRLGSYHDNNGFNLLYTDGAVRFTKNTIKPGTFEAILSRNGNRQDEPQSY